MFISSSSGSPSYPVSRDAESGFLVKSVSLRPVDDSKKARNARYATLCRLQAAIWSGALPKHGARLCSRSALPATVKKKDGSRVETGMPGMIEVHSREEGTRHNYHGMSRCASPLICPYCSAIIQMRRAGEVMTAGQYLLEHGFSVAMLTQTASHSRNTSLKDFVRRFQAAQRDMKAHRQYKRWQKETHAKFTIRAVETTDDNFEVRGKKTGWHFHSHTLIFFENRMFTEKEIKRYTQWIQKLWVEALAGVGLDGSIERAARLDMPRAAEKLEDARKEGRVEDVKKLCAYVSKAFGFEVSGGRNKKGREAGRRISVWELQEAALTDRPDLLNRYAEYMRAMKGVNWLRWSQGLKAFCGIEEESDKALMEQGEKGDEAVWQFSNADFIYVWRWGAQGLIIDAADEAGRDGIADLYEKLRSKRE